MTNDFYKNILIKIDDNVFIIDNTRNINFYINSHPIYNLSGKLINSNIFINPNDQFILTDNILNFILINKNKPTESLDFAKLFNIVNNTIKKNEIKLDNTQFITQFINLFDMCMYIYVCIAHASTLIKSFDDFIIKNIAPIDRQYALKTSLTIQYAKTYLTDITKYFKNRDDNKLMTDPIFKTGVSSVTNFMGDLTDEDFIKLYL